MNGCTATALVAEDHPGYRERVTALLQGWGLCTVAVNDGRAALAAIEADTAHDLLVTDMDMPHFTGFEVIEGWLRAGGRAEAVIMVTGEADSRDVQTRCALHGVRLVHKAAIHLHFEPAVRDALRWLATGRGDAPDA